jgi:GTPase
VSYNASIKQLNPAIQLLFVYLANPKFGLSEREKEVTELWDLVKSMGNANVVDLIVQKGTPTLATFIGPGKAQEIAEFLKTHQIDVVIISGTLTPNQKFNLTKMYWGINPKIEVWDRIDLILSIFSRHAHTREAMLQIELARMHHMGPSIFGMGMILSNQGAGIGTRGIGETNTELMKRHWKREIKRVTDLLAKLIENRKRQILNRKNNGLKTISLIGYTNAGKSTLFNLLTHKHNFVDNLLFATLDSTVGNIYIPEIAKIMVVSDTIGFIKDLPPDCIEAFKSTLLESIYADIVLHVIDISDPDIDEKINVVTEITTKLNIQNEKVILVFNKIDSVNLSEIERIAKHYDKLPQIFLSAKTQTGIDKLFKILLQKLNT